MKKYSWVWLLILCFSVILNLLLTSYVFISEGNSKILSILRSSDEENELSWTRRAAKEAEDVSSISCSGHGRAFLDGISSTIATANNLEGANKGDPLPSCECNSCYYGSDCSHFSPDCLADADSGDPLFLEPFWMKHAESSAVMVAGWHRMSYRFGYDQGTFISKELERRLRELHAMVGNANSTGKFMVFGAGSTQLLNAAIYALSPEDPPSPTSIVGSIPFYPLYKSQTDLFNSKNFEWEGDTSMWKNTSLPSEYNNSSVNFIEFVTSPNNPDGELKEPVLLKGPSVRRIFDHAYYWPHYTAIPAPANEDLMIFTLSKLTGHASSRFGWALMKDQGVYERFLNYMTLNSFGVSRDTQLRTLKLLKVVLGTGKELFEFGHRTTRTRWESLNKVLSVSKRFSLQKLIPRYSTYFQNITVPSPAYAWVKCEKEEDENCYEALLRDGGIIGRNGSIFHAENCYVRLSLIKSQDDFDWLLKRMTALVSQEQVHEEYGGKTI